MTFESITNRNQKSLVEYWKQNGLTIDDFSCRECGKFMLDLKNLKYAGYSPHAKSLQNKFEGYVESEQNRWLVKGRHLSGKVFFRHLCWDCFFKHLPEVENISKRALKSSWYRDIKNGILRPPASWTSPSKYFKLLFDITDEELENEHKKFDTASHESFVRRFGIKKGEEEFEKYRNRQAYTCSKEYMTKEHGMTEEEWHDYNLKRAVTLENLVLKHGEGIGKKMWDDYCKKQSYSGCKLDYFVEKYGQEIGKKKYIELNNKKQLTLENFVRKYGEQEGMDKWNLYLKHKTQNYSQISQKLFSEIDRLDQFSKEMSIYASKNGKEETITITVGEKTRIYNPDFVLGKKIIEFYGDFYHANPLKYNDDDVILQKTAKEVRKNDKQRIEMLESAGYAVKVVWENDYVKDKKRIIKECLEFIHGIS